MAGVNRYISSPLPHLSHRPIPRTAAHRPNNAKDGHKFSPELVCLHCLREWQEVCDDPGPCVPRPDAEIEDFLEATGNHRTRGPDKKPHR